MTQLWRIFHNSWMHLARNLWIGLATVFVFFTALLSVNVLLGANAMLTRVVALLEDKIDVTVTFQPETPDGLLTQAKSFVAQLPQTESVRLITADEALVAFRERNRNNPKVLEALNELQGNPLGAQLVIKARSPDQYPFLLQAIQNPQYTPFIKSSSYDDHRLAINRIQEVSRNVQLVGSGLVALFALFGLLTAFNAIRVAIYTHRDEIAIMRLVGASSGFIRAPFVLEGVWLALLAVAATAVIVWFSIQAIEPRLMGLFDGTEPGLRAFFLDQWMILLGVQTAIIAGLAALVSWIAAGRYIRR